MSAPTSEVDICNLILDELKQGPINSIETPVTKTEYILARNYDQLRRESLYAHPWKFAITRIELTPNPSTEPLFGYTYAYDLPTDYLRLITVGDDYIGDLRTEYEIENGQLLAVAGDVTFDGSTKLVRYMKDVTEVTKFSPGFIRYLVLRGAITLSNKFSVSPALKTDLKEDFERISTEAKAINGQERRPKKIQFSPLLSKRRGFPGGVFATKYTDFGS